MWEGEKKMNEGHPRFLDSVRTGRGREKGMVKEIKCIILIFPVRNIADHDVNFDVSKELIRESK